MSRRKQHQPRHFDTDPETQQNPDTESTGISMNIPGVVGNRSITRDPEKSMEEIYQSSSGHIQGNEKEQVPQESGSTGADVGHIQHTEIIKDPSTTNLGSKDKADLPPTNQTPLEYHKRLYLRTKATENTSSLKGGVKSELNTFNEIFPKMEETEWKQGVKDHDVEYELDDCQMRSDSNEDVKQCLEETSCKRFDPKCVQEKDVKQDISPLCSNKSSGMDKSGDTYEDEAVYEDNIEEEGSSEEDAVGSARTVNNVKLETLKNTSVAVAQIVENNLPSSDLVPSLMQTVFGLWQQQMMQCQMLEVVRQHLVKIAKEKNIHLPSLPIHSVTEDRGDMRTSDTVKVKHLQGSSSVRNSNSTSPLSQYQDREVFEDNKDSTEVPRTKVHANTSSSDQEKASTMGVTSPSTAAEVPSQFVRGGGNKLDVGTALDRSQYAAEDPLFRHKCRFCDKIFGSDSALQIHVRSHTGERPYECDVCGAKFSTRGNLKVHYEGHLLDGHQHKTNRPIEGGQPWRPPPDIKPPSTSLPPFSSSGGHFTSPPTADLPGKTEATSKDTFPFTSPTSSQSNIQAKYHFISSSSPMVGQVPPASFPRPPPPIMPSFNMTSPPQSITSDNGMPPPPPPVFMKTSILPQQDEDDALEQYMEITKSETSKLEAMVRNIETEITDPNQCIICKRVLSCKSALQMHYRTHTGERPFRCKICGRSFTTKGNLKTHMGVHRLKPPVRAMHQCPVCQKQFTNSVVLQQHMQSYHTDITPMLRPGYPGMMPPGSMMPFGGLPMMPQNFMDRMSPFSSASGVNSLTHSEYGQARDIEQSDCEDFDEHSEFGLSEADYPDIADGSMKRSRIDEEKIIYSETGSELKRPKIEQEHEDITDDEEVPRNIEKDHTIVESSNNRGYEVPLIPQSLSAESHSAGSNDHQTSSAKMDAIKRDDPRYHPNEKSFTDDIQSKLEMGKRVPYTYTSPSDNGEVPRDTVSPGDSSTSITNSDRNTPRTSSPGATPPLKTQYSPVDFLSHSLNFATGQPGYGTTCDLCFKTFACKSALGIHYRSHTKEKPFRCGLCDRGFSTKGNLKQHYLTHKIRELQEAGIDTSRTNDDGQNYEQHPDITPNGQHQNQALPPELPHYESNPSKVSPDKPEGGFHPSDIKRESTFQDPHAPSSLHQSFPPIPNGGTMYHPYSEPTRPVNSVQPLQRADHMDSEYQQAASLRHKCQVCHKPFSSASALQIHMRTHTGERPFKCMECNKAFTTKGNLKVHMSTHEERNTFVSRGHRMGMDGFPRFDSVPHSAGLPGFPSPQGFMQPLKGTPDLFMPRFPFIGLPGMNGFMSPRPNEIPVIQSSPNSHPMQMPSPLGKPKFSPDDKDQTDLTLHKKVTQTS